MRRHPRRISVRTYRRKRDAVPRCRGLGQRLVEHWVHQKWLDTFPKRSKNVLLIVGSPLMLKKVIFPVAPFKAWRVEQSLADCFPTCEGCCVCQCGSTTLQIMIIVNLSSSSSVSAKHGIRSLRPRGHDWRWTLCLSFLRLSEA